MVLIAFSVALQCVGALLLIFGSAFRLSRKKAIESYFSGRRSCVVNRNTNTLDYDRKGFISHYASFLLSLEAFVYILVGYFLSIFIYIFPDDVSLNINLFWLTLLIMFGFFLLGFLVPLILIKVFNVFKKPISLEECQRYGIDVPGPAVDGEALEIHL